MARVAGTPVARGIRAVIAAQLQVRVERQRPEAMIAATGHKFIAPWPALLARVQSGEAVELPARFVPRNVWPKRTSPNDRLRVTADNRIEPT